MTERSKTLRKLRHVLHTTYGVKHYFDRTEGVPTLVIAASAEKVHNCSVDTEPLLRGVPHVIVNARYRQALLNYRNQCHACSRKGVLSNPLMPGDYCCLTHFPKERIIVDRRDNPDKLTAAILHYTVSSIEAAKLEYYCDYTHGNPLVVIASEANAATAVNISNDILQKGVKSIVIAPSNALDLHRHWFCDHTGCTALGRIWDVEGGYAYCSQHVDSAQIVCDNRSDNKQLTLSGASLSITTQYTDDTKALIVVEGVRQEYIWCNMKDLKNKLSTLLMEGKNSTTVFVPTDIHIDVTSELRGL